MLKGISLETFCELAKKNAHVLLFQEFPSDTITPIGACLALEKEGILFDLLESTEKDTRVGRYSFICIDPFCEIRSTGVDILCIENGKSEKQQGDPLAFIRKKIQQYHAKSSLPILGPSNGAMGYVSYDAIRLFEDLPDRHHAKRKYPDFLCKIPRKGIIFDHKLKKVRLPAAFLLLEIVPTFIKKRWMNFMI